MWASIDAHIGTCWRLFEILGWTLKASVVGRAPPAPPSCYANVRVRYDAILY